MVRTPCFLNFILRLYHVMHDRVSCSFEFNQFRFQVISQACELGDNLRSHRPYLIREGIRDHTLRLNQSRLKKSRSEEEYSIENDGRSPSNQKHEEGQGKRSSLLNSLIESHSFSVGLLRKLGT